MQRKEVLYTMLLGDPQSHMACPGGSWEVGAAILG